MSGLSSAEGSPHRIKAAVLVALATATIAFSLFLNRPGHLIGDESVYHVMTRSFAEAGSLELLNGYQEFPSAELVFPVSHPIGGHLYAQYPYLFPVLAAPFYLMAGYKGLFLLNALAFVGVMWLCFAIAEALFRDRALALNACLILVAASYAWEYSQAAWPHAVSALFVTGAAYLGVRALNAEDDRRALLLAAAAGLVAGFGAGVRIDVFFVVPAIAAAFLLRHPWRLDRALALAAGAVPGLAVLAATNYAKFGIASPFSYGPKAPGSSVDPLSYLPVLALGVAALVLWWALSRPGVRRAVRARPGAAIGAGAAVLAAALLVPEVWALVSRLGKGAYQLLVDLRVRDLGIIEGGLTRGPGGSLIYMGALKKSLLQSCPYLVAAVVPLAALLCRRREAGAIGFLLLLTGAFVAPFSYFAWHGGHSLNLRYFVPILPFTSILASYAWREVTAALPSGRRPVIAGMGLATVLLFLAIYVLPLQALPVARLEEMLLTGPLVLAGVLLALLVLAYLPHPRVRSTARGAAAAALFVGFVWAGTVAVVYDYPRAWAKRAARHALSQEMAALVAPDSILFVAYATPLSGLYDADQVRLAQPTWDDFRGFRPLVDFHLAAGRPIYAWFDPATWDRLEREGLLAGLEAGRVGEVAGQPLTELRRLRPEMAPGSPQINENAKRPPPTGLKQTLRMSP